MTAKQLPRSATLLRSLCLIAFALSLLGAPVSAQIAGIAGFQSLRWGMSIDEVRALTRARIDGVPHRLTRQGAQILQLQDVSILGIPGISAEFGFEPDSQELAQVTFAMSGSSPSKTAPHQSLRYIFSRMKYLLIKTHGPVSGTIDGGFRWVPNGTSVELVSGLVNGRERVAITYLPLMKAKSAE